METKSRVSQFVLQDGVGGPVTTPANTNDVAQQAHVLPHGEEKVVFGDADYQGVEMREGNLNTGVEREIAMQPGQQKTVPNTPIGRLKEKIEQLKTSIRAKVEHPFHTVKSAFGLKKARNKGLAKNTAQLYRLFGLANLLIAKRRLFALNAQGAS